MKIDDIYFELREPTRRTKERAVTSNEIPVFGEKMPSDDEMLFYSSGPPVNVMP